jgi:hypothetical protein
MKTVEPLLPCSIGYKGSLYLSEQARSMAALSYLDGDQDSCVRRAGPAELVLPLRR